MTCLGAMYSSGQGVAHDDAEAVYWIRKAAEAGDPGSALTLSGLMLLRLRG